MTAGRGLRENPGPCPGGISIRANGVSSKFLGRPAGIAVEEAPQRLGCTVRTVWRDLGVLQEAGFQIYDERDGRRGLWKVDRAFLDRLPIPFSLPDVVALLASRHMPDQAGAEPFGPSVASAFAKIETLMTPRALALVDRMRRSVGARAVGAKLQLGSGQHLAEIHRALAERRTLRLRHYSLSRDAESDRHVDPYHVTHFGEPSERDRRAGRLEYDFGWMWDDLGSTGRGDPTASCDLR